MTKHPDTGIYNILNNSAEVVYDYINKQKEAQFSDKEDSVSAQMSKLFGRQKSIYNILGGGKSADVLLWRDKKISTGVLASATIIWVLFEWLNYHFLTLACLGLVGGMVIQFLWSNASGIVSRSPSTVPRLVLPDELFVNIAVSLGAQINMFLGFIQDAACGGNLKQFLAVVVSLWGAAIIGSWCNFLTVLYVGYVAVHTLPVLYERYEDQVDEVVANIFGKLQIQYQKLDAGVLSKIPKGNLKPKKSE